jgi:SAM-dependent methyltransferase
MFNNSSYLMNFVSKFFGERYAWRLRRFHVPVSKTDLVLEVGSGGNPYGRSNVLIDGHLETRERHFAPLVSDRPTVVGFAENLPFKDNSFDFLIAAHVLEHSKDPVQFLAEIQRVSKAGYIEVPDAFMERLNPYKDHRLEITVRDNILVITKKAGWKHDPELVELYEDRAKEFVTKELMPSRPFAFHTRFYWTDKIDYKVNNADVDCNWARVDDEFHDSPQYGKLSSLRELILSFSRWLTSQNSRNKKLDIQPLLQCPRCKKGGLIKLDNRQKCDSCGASFDIIQDISILS